MAMRWYVVQAYSGFEDRVQKTIRENAERAGLEACFGQILVPKEEVVELRNGQKVSSQQKFFPGYVLVEMELTDDTWHIVKSTDKVSGFLGSDRKPRPITQAEVERLTQQIEQGVERPRPKVLFEVGEAVRVIEGPLASFNGVVEEVDEERGILKISVSIFGRPTPVELEYVQVEKG